MSEEIIYKVGCYTGKTFRLSVTDCAGSLVTAEDVDSMTYTVYHMELGRRTAVEGHSGVSIPSSSLKSSSQTGDNGKLYNFEYRVSGAEHLPFPAPGEHYLVVFLFMVSGEPYGTTIHVMSDFEMVNG